MKVDKIVAVIRPRNHYEALDLGIALTRQAGWALWKPWFVVTLPAFALCNLLGWYLGIQWLAALLMWWLKLLFDRIPLYVLSRYLFGETPALRETLRALPGLWLSALPGALLWDRIDFARSFDLPVAQLEGMRWMARIRRQRVLQSTARSAAVALTFICLGLEVTLVLGVWALVLMFVPFEYLSEAWKATWATLVTDVTPTSQFIINAVAYLAMSCIEPLYVGAGFGLYLNRRTELEAWDIELAFRRLADRLAGLKRGAAAMVAALALCLCCALPLRSAKAADLTPAVATKVAVPRAFMVLPTALPADADARFAKSVQDAYKDPDLSPEDSVGHWEWRQAPKAAADAKLPGWLKTLQAVYDALRDFAGKTVSYLPWVLAIALLAVAVRYRRWLLAWFETGGPVPPRRQGGGMDDLEIVGETLPEDLAAAARGLWQRGRHREALALLYRGTVRRVQDLTGRELPYGATEADCLRAAASLPAVSGEGARRIVRAWQYAAYAHRLPEPEAFDLLLTVWRDALGAQA